MATPKTRWGTPEHSERLKRERKASFARIAAGEGFIYVAKIIGTRRVKIGFSLNPKRRITDCAHFKSSNPRRLLAVIPGSFEQERALHRALREHQILFAGKRSEVYPRSILTHPAIPAELRTA